MYTLKTEEKATVVNALAEGSSIRSIERMTGFHRDTIMRLGVRVGQECQRILDSKMKDLPCKTLQFDEIWGFVGKKQRNADRLDQASGIGDVWTFLAVDADTRLVPAYRVGKRDSDTANAFVEDVAGRLKNRVQISTDGLRAYVEAIERSFGGEVDYGQIVKTFAGQEGAKTPSGRYSPPEVVSVKKDVIVGKPKQEKISTSYVERVNLTMRMHCRRLTRLTNAFSKKLENFKAAIGLSVAYYNLVKPHASMRCTPAMAAGVESRAWTVQELVEMTT